MTQPKVFLSRRNLLVLLSKLDRRAGGDATACTIIKYRGSSPENQQTMAAIEVVAVEDAEYYESQERAAGDMHPLDEAALPPITGDFQATFVDSWRDGR